ncbi:hypothetical protein H9P43_005073 [Blastocladiella emersonii ATCC 22665]|nr:hypothetical protein H9P43_005073 [Blastocladiella emersonii ATCC 22665]
MAKIDKQISLRLRSGILLECMYQSLLEAAARYELAVPVDHVPQQQQLLCTAAEREANGPTRVASNLLSNLASAAKKAIKDSENLIKGRSRPARTTIKRAAAYFHKKGNEQAIARLDNVDIHALTLIHHVLPPSSSLPGRLHFKHWLSTFVFDPASNNPKDFDNGDFDSDNEAELEEEDDEEEEAEAKVSHPAAPAKWRYLGTHPFIHKVIEIMFAKLSHADTLYLWNSLPGLGFKGSVVVGKDGTLSLRLAPADLEVIVRLVCFIVVVFDVLCRSDCKTVAFNEDQSALYESFLREFYPDSSPSELLRAPLHGASDQQSDLQDKFQDERDKKFFAMKPSGTTWTKAQLDDQLSVLFQAHGRVVFACVLNTYIPPTPSNISSDKWFAFGNELIDAGRRCKKRHVCAPRPLT